MAVAQRLLPFSPPAPSPDRDRDRRARALGVEPRRQTGESRTVEAHAPQRGQALAPLPAVPEPTSSLTGPRALLPPELRDRLQTARELSRAEADRPREERFPSGLPALDHLLAGGLARGRLVELRGAPGSGRFACVLALLATATARGEATALVDLGDQLDPQQAREQGIELSRLLWLRPPDLTAALAASEVALAGAFPLVVLELGLPPVPGGRGREAAWRRLARAARHHHGALLVSAPYPVSGSAAAEVVRARSARALWRGAGLSPRLLAGSRSRLELEKGRGSAGKAPHGELALARADPAVAPPPPPPVAPRGRQAPAWPPGPGTTRPQPGLPALKPPGPSPASGPGTTKLQPGLPASPIPRRCGADGR